MSGSCKCSFFIRISVAVARVAEPCAFLLYIDPDQILLFYRSGNNIVVVANFLHYISLWQNLLTVHTQICFKMRFSYPFSFEKNLNLTFPTGSAILPLAVSVPIETETAREKAHWYLWVSCSKGKRDADSYLFTATFVYSVRQLAILRVISNPHSKA